MTGTKGVVLTLTTFQKPGQTAILADAVQLVFATREDLVGISLVSNIPNHTIMGGIEKPLVEIVLKETGGNQTQAANILGVNRNTLRKKIAEYKIKCNNKT
ncbi:MAG: hypothetical protein F3745_01160 [Nitrospinae bacterium]|nr:hypothetical protein [Nitrospinota bacterium]